MQNRNKATDVENKTKGTGVVGMDWEIRTDIYIYIYIYIYITMYRIKNKQALTVQHRKLYSVLCGDLKKKEIEGRRDIRTCVADSLC